MSLYMSPNTTFYNKGNQSFIDAIFFSKVTERYFPLNVVLANIVNSLVIEFRAVVIFSAHFLSSLLQAPDYLIAEFLALGIVDPMLVSGMRQSSPESMVRIFRCGGPFQISWTVVPFISIEMISDMFRRWSLPIEGFANDAMNEYVFVASVVKQSDSVIPASPCLHELQKSTRLSYATTNWRGRVASYKASVRNAVDALIPRDLFPCGVVHA